MFRKLAPLVVLSMFTGAAMAWGEGQIAPGFDAPPAPHPDAIQLDGLPVEAQKLVVAFDKEATEIRLKAKQEIEARQDKLIQQLTKLQDAYSKPGTLDEAVAIRDRIRQLKSDLRAAAVDAKPDPGMLMGFRGQLGKVFHFRVTGNAAGFVFGSDVYTDDSNLATAAVHAGVLRDGQTGIVKVTIHPGQPIYPGMQRNGVSSYAWQDFPGSYRVEAP